MTYGYNPNHRGEEAVMSFSRHPLDDIHVGDYVVLEVAASYAGEEPCTYRVSGTVRMYDRVKCVGINGLGGGKIVEHRPRSLPTAFGSRLKYPVGTEWVKVDGENWRSDTGYNRLNREMGHDWILLHDAGAKA